MFILYKTYINSLAYLLVEKMKKNSGDRVQKWYKLKDVMLMKENVNSIMFVPYKKNYVMFKKGKCLLLLFQKENDIYCDEAFIITYNLTQFNQFTSLDN